MYGINCKRLSCLAIVLLTILSVIWTQGLPVTTGQTATTRQNFPSWRKAIHSVPTPQRGCFTVAYPSIVWQAARCVTAPLIPLEPRGPSTVGDGVDEVAYSGSGTLIGSSTGSFPSVTGLSGETDSLAGTNYYSLQINTQFFSATTPYTDNQLATGWEQFVFVNDPGDGVGYIFIQYWLLNFQYTYGICPGISPPGGSSWMPFEGNCYANSPGAVAPLEAASDLSNLVLEGHANLNSNDEVLFCVSGGSCYAVSPTDQVLGLYQQWVYSEFNVLGFSDASQAEFNSGTSITISNTLEDQNGNPITPSCVNTGYTAETNNLNLGSCSTSGNDEILFNENNGQTVNPQASVSPSTVAQGQSVSYTGSGFTPNGEVTVEIDSGSGFGYVVGTPTASGSGTISGSFIVGTNIAPGTRQITFTDTATGLTATADITVTELTATLNPTTVTQGQSVTYAGSGFTPNGQATVVLDSGYGYGYVVGTPTATSSGTISGSFVAGTNILPGTRPVTFTDTSSNDVTTVDLQVQTLTVTATQTTTETAISTTTALISTTSTYGTTTTTMPISTSTQTVGEICSTGTTQTVTGVEVATRTSTATSTLTMISTVTSISATTTSYTSTLTSVIYTTTTLTACTETVTSTSTSTTTGITPEVTMTVSYSIQGGGSPSAPAFNYVEAGVPQSYTLTTTPTAIQVDPGSSWSVTPNPLTGSDSSEQWFSGQQLSGTASASGTFVFTFYHQDSETLSFTAVSSTTTTSTSVTSPTKCTHGCTPVSPASAYSAPQFTAESAGASSSVTLTTTPTSFWFDDGSTWTVPVLLPGSSSSEQWITTQTGGTITVGQSLIIAYQDQVYLSVTVTPTNSGSATPPTGWQDPGNTVTLQATPANGGQFSGWTVTGASCSGDPTLPSCTFTMPDNPVTAVATFSPISVTSTTTATTVLVSTVSTSSASTTSTVQSTVSSTSTAQTRAPVITNTVVLTTTTAGLVASTSTATFISPLSTSYSTSTVTSSSESVTQTGTTTTGTIQSEATTSTGTQLSTTTSGGTATVSETDTFNVLLTQIYQELEQFEGFIVQTLDFQVTPTPVGQQVNEVIVTTTPTASGSALSVAGPVAPGTPPSGGTSTSTSVKLEVRVTTNGAPVGGASVSFYVGGVVICSAYPTGPAGLSNTCSFAATMAGHTYAWYVTVSKTGYSTVTSPTWTFTYNPTAKTYSTTSTVKLTTARSVTVTATLYSGTTPIAVGYYTFTGKGTKSVVFPMLNSGTYTVTITGPGVTTQSQSATVPPNKTISFTIT